MRFGLFGSANVKRGATEGTPGQGYFDFIDQNVLAEKLGYHATFLVEHHFTGVGQVSASLSLLTWLAAKTTSLRLGTAVVVLPWHNPVLLAEQAATLDLLSGGRLEFGVGRGYRFPEFDGFCMPMQEAEPRFDEALDLILKAWNSDARFSHQGQFWSYNNIVVEPPVFQQPHPPVWIAAGSKASIEKVAARGCNLLLDQFASPETIAVHIETYRAALESNDMSFSPYRVAVARYVCVSDNEAEVSAARERLLRSNSAMVERSRSPSDSDVSHILRYTERAGGPAAHALYGSPAKVAQSISELRRVGVEYLLLSTNDHGQTVRSFGEKLLPKFY